MACDGQVWSNLAVYYVGRARHDGSLQSNSGTRYIVLGGDATMENNLCRCLPCALII
jgi:hypothetical protein